MQMQDFLNQSGWILAVSIITLPIKAYALWQSSRLSQKWWFIVLFVSNTFGILDLLYIFLIARKYKVETREIS